MNFKPVTYIFLFTFLSVICFGQIKSKKLLETLYSSNTPGYIKGYERIPSGACGGNTIEWLERDEKKLDSLQLILEIENETLVRFRKNYLYVMEVYSDYSYTYLKEFLFLNDWHWNDTYGIRVLDQSFNYSLKKVQIESAIK